MTARGGGLIILLLVGFTLYDLGRFSLPPQGESTFFVEQGALVQLRDDQGLLDGIHQINDAAGLISVIKLAKLHCAPQVLRKVNTSEPLESGKSYEFKIVGGEVVSFSAGWMPAAKRMALGIPLAVEKMTFDDWCDLPGVGPALAERILNYRQKNGDMVAFQDLIRVPGVGSKRLEQLRIFFEHG